MKRKNAGFTLAELLIVVAIIAVLVAIAIPIFTKRVEKANEVVDLNNIRLAKTVSVLDLAYGDVLAGHYYNYDAQTQTLTHTIPEGYGRSKIRVEGANGVPRSGGRANYLVIQIGAYGAENIRWSGGGYTGHNITSKEDYEEFLKKSQAEQRAQDWLLLYSLQDQVRNMTYRELLGLVREKNLKRGDAWGTTCYELASSKIRADTHEVDTAKTWIKTPELFENAGFEITSDSNHLYVFNSRPGVEVTIWVDIGSNRNAITEADLDRKASNAIIYTNEDRAGGGPIEFNHPKHRQGNGGVGTPRD